MQAGRDVPSNEVIRQLDPRDEVRPVSLEKVKDEILQIFASHSDIKVRRMSYGAEVILIGLTAVLISFTIYTMIWLVANNAIYDMSKHGYKMDSVTFVDLLKVLGSYYFWFGFALLIIPAGIYIFAFLIYFDMLYDSRSVEITRLLTKDPGLKKDFFNIFWNRFKPEFNKMLAERPSEPKVTPRIYLSESRIRDTLVIPENNIKSYEHKLLKKLALKSRWITMADLLGKVSLRMDESTIRGYFFAFTLLQIIVSVSFVAPALEFSQVGRIGTNLLLTSSGAPGDTATFLSFWAIEWAVFGAFVYSFISLMDRIPRQDITPRYYLIVALRYIFAIALSSLFFLIYGQISSVVSGGAPASNPDVISYGGVAALSFSIGMFPNRFFRMLGSFVHKRLGGSFSRDIGLENFTGISANEATRLWEEGVENVDQLSDHTVQHLYSKTKFNPNRLMELIGRALLWKFVFGLENMLVLLNLIEAPKVPASASETEKRLEEIRACRFTDIQGLCSFLFKKPFEKIDNEQQIAIDLSSVAGKIHIPEEILVQVIARIPQFQHQLSFVGSEKGIEEVAKIELANLLDLPVPTEGTEPNINGPDQPVIPESDFLKWWKSLPAEITNKARKGDVEETPLLNQVNYVLVRLHRQGSHQAKPNHEQLTRWIRDGQISLTR